MSVPLSYVLPVFNAESWLQRTVEVLLDDLAQQQNCFELLIIDDGSSDETAQVARQLSATYPQITFVRRDSRFGSDAALQLALRQAKGDRVVMIVEASNDSAERHFRRIELAVNRTRAPIAAPHFGVNPSATQDAAKS